jgi:glycopeptide antibiotics resistance protein
LRARVGYDVFQVTQLGDVVEAVGRRDKPFLLDFSLETTANILLFLPFGAALGLFGFSTGKTAFYGFVLSAFVGCAQWLVISGRTTSLDDVLLNTLGAVLGQVLWSRFTRRRTRLRAGRSGKDKLAGG